MTETLNKINADTNETEKIVDNAGKNASAIHHTIEQAKKEIQVRCNVFILVEYSL